MSTTTATTVGLALEPLDVLFFRDGRPFMSSNEQMVSGLPLPQTLAGAIRAALLRMAGCDFGRLKQEIQAGLSFAQTVKQACLHEYRWIGQMTVRGPWLARWVDEEKNKFEVLVTAPAILHAEKTNTRNSPLLRLAPLPAAELPGWSLPQGWPDLRPLWLKHLPATERVKGYLTATGLAQFLQGNTIDANAVVRDADLFERDFRIGIGITPDRLVAAESQIYGCGFLALKDKVFFYAEVLLPDRKPAREALEQLTTLALGGEGRHVSCRCLAERFAWPNATPRGDKQKPLILLTTPCVFADGWKPKDLVNHLASAAVPDPIAFSGWDLARGGPKPTRFAVPAGSVYFLESALDNWPSSLAETDDERQQGWGCYVTGVWTDE
jgi:CRISPR-associated protein Cmr3